MLRSSIEKSLRGSDIELVKVREGEVLHWYKDSLGKETGGVGHLRKKGDPDTFGQYQSIQWLLNDILGSRKAASKQLSKLPYQTQALYDALVSCNFQFGNDFDTDFPGSWGLLVKGDYPSAIKGFQGTLWARQTPQRVKDLVEALKHTIDCYTQYQSYE